MVDNCCSKKPSPRMSDFYMIVKVEKPWWKGVSIAKIALFDEVGVGSQGRILEHIPTDQIIRFMERFMMIEIRCNAPDLELVNYRFYGIPENYTAMIILTDENGLQLWRDFTRYKFKAAERGAAVAIIKR